MKLLKTEAKLLKNKIKFGSDPVGKNEYDVVSVLKGPFSKIEPKIFELANNYPADILCLRFTSGNWLCITKAALNGKDPVSHTEYLCYVSLESARGIEIDKSNTMSLAIDYECIKGQYLPRTDDCLLAKIIIK